MSGFIDGVRRKAEDAYDAVSDAASEAVDAASDVASEAAEGIEETARAATEAIEDVGAAAEAQFERLANDTGAAIQQARAFAAETAGTIEDEARELLSETGQAIEDAGQKVRDAAGRVRDHVSETVWEGLDAAGRTAEEIGRGIAGIRDDVANRVREFGELARETGRETVRLAEEGVRELGERARDLGEDAIRLGREALDGARRAGEAIYEKGKDLYDRVETQLDPKTHIDKLDSEGDSVKVKLGGFVQATIEGVPVRAQAGGEMEIKKTADGYEMEVTGQAGLGLYAEMGQQGGANAVLQGTGKVTMKFSGPHAAEDAARAAQAVSRFAAAQAARQAAGGGLTGMAAEKLIGPSAADMKFIADHVRSVELRGGVAAEIAGELQGGTTMSGKLAASGDVGVRLTFPERDASGKVTRGAVATVFLEGQIQGEGEIANGWAARGGFEGKVTLERDFKLPKSVTGERLLEDPVDTIRAIARDTQPSPDVRLKIEGQVRAGAGVTVPGVKAHAGGQVGGRFELALTGNRDDLERAAGQALEGDLRGALETADRRATVQGEVGWFTNQDLQFAPEVKSPAGGIGIDASYRHHDRHHRAQLESRRPSEAIAELERFLAQLDPQAAGTGAPRIGRP